MASSYASSSSSSTTTPLPDPPYPTGVSPTRPPRATLSRREASRSPQYHPHRQNHRQTPLVPRLQLSKQPPMLPFPNYSATPPPRRSRPKPPTTPVPEPDSPRFSRLLSSVLGSPFLTTTDLPLQSDLMDLDTVDPRPTSPAPSADFSIINVDVAEEQVVPGSYPVSLGRLPETFSWPSTNFQQDSPHNPLKTILPRIWDAISTPGRSVLTFTPSRTPSPPPRIGSWYLAESSEDIPTYPARAKGKTRGFFLKNGSRDSLDDVIDYSDLEPLDGEEGELIDDEACFVDVRAVTGIDILSLLPPELALHILLMLCPPPLDYTSGHSATRSSSHSHALSVDTEQVSALHAILACRLVSHTWRRLASDNAVWRALFLGRWGIDLRRAGARSPADLTSLSPRSLGETWTFDWGQRITFFGSGYATQHGARETRGRGSGKGKPSPSKSSKQPQQTRPNRSSYIPQHRISFIRPPPSQSNSLNAAPLQLDWRLIYRERLELDARWSGAACSADSPPPLSPLGIFDGDEEREEGTAKENRRPWEPSVRQLEGHSDSVYCVEFDSKYIITGSRDRTIKVWSLRTGQVVGTFRNAHSGSVLCLKFEKEWSSGLGSRFMDGSAKHDTNGDGSMQAADATERVGVLVSGSSDCSIRVWEMTLGDILPGTGAEREVKARVVDTLLGHEGGVLDIRMDEKWIVSCSKDASIRVWDRRTLALSRVLRGHEGPVNAIGLQCDRVVSASGDGKLILWDVTNGERIRTFEGHDRGLACVEFKDDFIVSGSNDCKIKVWDPWTGECLRTLAGHEGLVRALCFDPKIGRLVSVSYDKTIKVWDFRQGKLIREFKDKHASHIFDVKFDASRIVTTSHDHKIVELDFSAGLDASLFI